jgi:cytochrome b6-f complex iron-sulfur subunit
MQKSDKITLDSTQSSRRSFLTKLWLGLGVLALAEFIGVIIAFLWPRKPRTAEGGFGHIVVAGEFNSFAINTVTAFPMGHFYLCRLEDGGFLALSRKCTHLGCTVPWMEEDRKFVCPCHSSAFDMRGNVINTPAPRALDLYAISIENNIVKVNTGQRIRRTEFRPEQVTYPKDA